MEGKGGGFVGTLGANQLKLLIKAAIASIRVQFQKHLFTAFDCLIINDRGENENIKARRGRRGWRKCVTTTTTSRAATAGERRVNTKHLIEYV